MERIDWEVRTRVGLEKCYRVGVLMFILVEVIGSPQPACPRIQAFHCPKKSLERVIYFYF